MNRRLIAVIVAVLAVSVVLVSFLTLKTKTPKPATSEVDVKEYLKQAETSLKEGDLLKAKAIYARIVEKHPDSKFVEKAQEELEKLNIRILFSPVKTKNSITYVVDQGDTLRKIAKRYNTTVELLQKSNRLNSDFIRPGQRLKVVKTKFSIITDKSQNALTLKTDDEVLKVYKVSTGIDNTTPTGKFKIVNKLMDPTWFKAGAVVQSGSPENILGSRWMGLSIDGYGIHGTTQPDTIGKHITAGCIRMLNEEVEELYSIVPVGTEVTIVD